VTQTGPPCTVSRVLLATFMGTVSPAWISNVMFEEISRMIRSAKNRLDG
jgi:hypothetical protein